MDNIRIGNTFEVSWAINQFDGTETVPYDLAGKDLTLILANALSKVRVEKFSVIGNIISFTFEGKDQRHAGKYSLILIENNGVDGMHMVDVCDAFRLVNRSCETCDDPSSIVDCTHIDFASTMLSRRGISAYEYAKLNGYEGTEEEYAAECRAIPELKDQVQEIVDKAAEDIQAAIESFDKTLQGKQDTIEDLETIRSGAAKGATAAQNVSSSNANYATVRREGFEWIISPRTQKISEAGDPVFYKSGIADAYDVKQELIKKVDKVVGKQLSTEDFTTALKQKLQGLSNYDDSTLTSAINSLQSQINTLVSGNVSSAIDTFNEIIAFLDGVKDTQDLAGIIASIEQQIAGVNSSLSAELAKKPNKTDIATINGQSLIEGGNIVIEGKNYDAEIAARNVGAVDVEGGAEAPDAPGGSYDDTEIQAKLIELSEEIEKIQDEIGESAAIDIALPKVISAVVGDNMQIFFRSIVSAINPSNYDIYAVCSVGKSYPRYYEFKPTENMVGNQYPLTLFVKNNNGEVVAQQTATIEVHNTISAPSSAKNVLCVGDSITTNGVWVGELRRRLTATDGNGTPSNPNGLGLSNINFVGRKVGTSINVNFEATGGWSVQNYASQGQRAIRFYVNGVDTIALGARYSCNGTIYMVQEVNVTEGNGNIRCTLENTFAVPSGKLTKLTGSGDAEIAFSSYEDENFSPFWNATESRIDFKQYADTYCNGHIDCLVWLCGTNDIASGNAAVIPNVINAFRNIFEAYHADFPNGKVIISSVPIGSVKGGFGANYGASAYLNYYTYTLIAQKYAKALSELCAETQYQEYVAYSSVLEEFDADSGYPTTPTAVNNRSSVKEDLGANAVHPNMEGTYLIADSMYRAFNTIDISKNQPIAINPLSSKEKVYIPKGKGAAIATISTAIGVVSYAIETGKNYKLVVPKTYNEYAAIYAFGQQATNGVVDTGVVLLDQYGIGNQQSADLQVMTENLSYKYLYVCYALDGGMPTLTRL